MTQTPGPTTRQRDRQRTDDWFDAADTLTGTQS